MDDVLEMDMEQLDWRSAFTGLVGLLIALVFVGAFGNAGVAAGIAVLFVVGADEDSHTGPDLAQLLLVLIGAVVTYAVGESTTSTAAAAIVFGLVTLGSTLLLLLGERYAAVGTYSLMWAVIALTIGVTEATAGEMTVAFAAGGAVALVVLFVSSVIGPRTIDAGDEAAPSPDPHSTAGSQEAIITFSVVRAIAAALAVVIGFEWFADHPAWTVLTFVLVLRPPKEQAIAVAASRTLGTVAGVLIGMAAAQLVGDSLTAQLAAFLVAGFFMLATSGLNYAVSTAFTTAMLLLSERILHEDVYEAGWARLGATVAGVVIAFLAIGILGAIRSLRQPTKTEVTP